MMVAKMIDDDTGSGTTTTLRVVRPDGTVVEVVRDDDGRVTVTRWQNATEVATRFVAEIGASGLVTVTRQNKEGQVDLLEPLSVDTTSNSFGTMIEELTFDGGTSVSNRFDDDGNLRSVTMRGDWGEQTMELRPDGARELQWSTALHRGVRRWNAAGVVDHYRLDSNDGTCFRFDRVGDSGRRFIEDWDGRIEVTDTPSHAPDDPASADPARPYR